jgi:YHS domain-containing protein
MRTTNLNFTRLVTAIALLCAVVALAEAPATETEPAETEAGEKKEAQAQTTCPVGGNPIDKDVFVTYQGQKIYFCCAGCDDSFLESPETYLKTMGEQGVIVESVQTVCPIAGEKLENKDTFIDYKQIK